MKGPLDKHSHWQLVDDLDRLADEFNEVEVGGACRKAASLIRQLKMENRKHRDFASRLQFPDTTGK